MCVTLHVKRPEETDIGSSFCEHGLPQKVALALSNMYEVWSLVYEYCVNAHDEQAASALRGFLRGLGRVVAQSDDDVSRKSISKVYEDRVDLLPAGYHRSYHDVPMAWWVSDFLKRGHISSSEECCCELFGFPAALMSQHSKTHSRQRYHDDHHRTKMAATDLPTFGNYLERMNCCSCIHDEEGRIILGTYKVSLMAGVRCTTAFLVSAKGTTASLSVHHCSPVKSQDNSARNLHHGHMLSAHTYPCVRHTLQCGCDVCHPVLPPKRLPLVQKVDSDKPTLMVVNPCSKEQGITIPASELSHDSLTNSYYTHGQTDLSVKTAIDDIARSIPTCESCHIVCLCHFNFPLQTKADRTTDGVLQYLSNMHLPPYARVESMRSSNIRNLPLSTSRFESGYHVGVSTVYLLELDKAFYVCHDQYMEMQEEDPHLELFYPKICCPSQVFLRGTFTVAVQVLQVQLVWTRRGMEECVSDVVCEYLHKELGKSATKVLEDARQTGGDDTKVFTNAEAWPLKSCVDLNMRPLVPYMHIPITNARDDGFTTGMFYSATEMLIFRRSVGIRHPSFAYELFSRKEFGNLFRNSYSAVVGDVHTYDQEHAGPDIDSFFNLPFFSDCSVHDNVSWVDKLYQGHFTKTYARTFLTERRMHFLNSSALVVFTKLDENHNYYDMFPFGYSYDDDDESEYDDGDWRRNCDPNSVETVINNTETGITDLIVSCPSIAGSVTCWPNVYPKLHPDETAFSSTVSSIDSMVSLLANIGCYESYSDLWDGPRLMHDPHGKGSRNRYKMMKEFSASFITSFLGDHRFRSNIKEYCNKNGPGNTTSPAAENAKCFINDELLPAMQKLSEYQETLNTLTRESADGIETTGYTVSVDAMTLDPTYFWHVCTMIQKVNDNHDFEGGVKPFCDRFQPCADTGMNLSMLFCLACLLRSAYLCNSNLFHTFMDYAKHCANERLTALILMADFQAAIMFCVSLSETPDTGEALRILSIVEEMYTQSVSNIAQFEAKHFYIFKATAPGHFGKLPPDAASFGLCFCLVNWEFQHAMKLYVHMSSPIFVLSQTAYFRSASYANNTLLDIKRFYHRLCVTSLTLNPECNIHTVAEKLLWAGIDGKDLYDANFIALGSTYCTDRCCKYQKVVPYRKYADGENGENKENIVPRSTNGEDQSMRWNPERMTFMTQGNLNQHFCNCVLCCPFSDERNIHKDTGSEYLNSINDNFVQLICADKGNMTRNLKDLEDRVARRDTTYRPLDLYPFLVTSTVGMKDGLLKLLDMKARGQPGNGILNAATLDYQIMAYFVSYCHHMQWVLRIMKERFDFAVATLSSADLSNLYVTWSHLMSPSDYSSSYFTEPFSVCCLRIAPLLQFLKSPEYYPHAAVCHTSMLRKCQCGISYCNLLEKSKVVEAIMKACYQDILRFREYFQEAERLVNKVRYANQEAPTMSQATMDAMFRQTTPNIDEMVALNRAGVCANHPSTFYPPGHHVSSM